MLEDIALFFEYKHKFFMWFVMISIMNAKWRDFIIFIVGIQRHFIFHLFEFRIIALDIRIGNAIFVLCFFFDFLHFQVKFVCYKNAMYFNNINYTRHYLNSNRSGKWILGNTFFLEKFFFSNWKLIFIFWDPEREVTSYFLLPQAHIVLLYAIIFSKCI